MLGIALALGSSVCWGISDFLGGLQSRRISVLTVLLVSQPVGLGLALAVAVVAGGGALSAADVAIATGAGATGVLALAAFYRAMALGSVSVVATIGALGIAVPVVAGIAGGDSPSAIQGAGAVAAFAGAVLVAREPDPEWRRATAVSVGLAALAGVGFGLFFWGLDLASPPNPAWTIVCARIGGVAMLVAVALAVRPALRIERGMAPALAAIAVCDVAANSLFAVATNHGLLSLVAVAGSLYSAVTVLLARLVLGERLAPVQRAGVVLALVGVAALAGGSS
jgi:drug/metabolite transporter (DMT)-like permease